MALELKYKEFRKMSTNVSVQSYQGFWILISINELAVFSSISDTGYDTVITTLGQKDIWNGLCPNVLYVVEKTQKFYHFACQILQI